MPCDVCGKEGNFEDTREVDGDEKEVCRDCAMQIDDVEDDFLCEHGNQWSEGCRECCKQLREERNPALKSAAEKLSDILSDCIERGVISESSAPDDYEAIVAALLKVNEALNRGTTT